MFTAQDFKNRRAENPFVPFQIVTKSGETWNILHPNLLRVWSDYSVVAATPFEGDFQVVDEIKEIWLTQIAEVRNLNSPIQAIG